MIINQGNFENFSYNENTFDKICSSNTIYFWQHPEIYIMKIGKILKPSGKVVLAFEDKENLANKPLSPEIFKTYSRDEILNLLSKNGISKDVDIFTKEKGSQKYHCAVAFK
jgi:SAM-dependent methyltransferase